MDRRAEYLEALKKFRLLDDTFMKKVFADPACAQLLLRVLLDRADLEVQEVQTQVEMKNLAGRSACLDIYATDSQGTPYNVEVQRAAQGANPRRARYHSALIDMGILDPGAEFKALPETYVIFMTETDVLKKGLPLYHIERRIEELGTFFGDGAHILYANAAYKNDGTALGRLLEDMRETDPDKFNYPLLAEAVRHFKESEEGQKDMCQIMEDIRKKGREEGREEGQEECLLGSIRNLMANAGCALKEAMRLLGIPENEWEKYAKLLQQ